MRLSERVKRLEAATPKQPETYHIRILHSARPLPPPWEYETTEGNDRCRFIIEHVSA